MMMSPNCQNFATEGSEIVFFLMKMIREKSMPKETRKNVAKNASARKMGGATVVNPSIQLVGVDCTLAAVDFTKI